MISRWRHSPAPSILIVIVVIVELLFLDDIEFDGIQANNLQLDSTLFAINHFALVHVNLHVNVGIAFWARSGRHFGYLQRKFLSVLQLSDFEKKQSNRSPPVFAILFRTVSEKAKSFH
jgi:hypothetical protein